jgi:hypothetical protein
MKHIMSKGYVGGGGVKQMSRDDLVSASTQDWYFNATSGSRAWFAFRVQAEADDNDIVIPKAIALSASFANDIRQEPHFIARTGLRERFGWMNSVELGALGNYYNLQLDSGGLNPVKAPLVLSEGWHKVTKDGVTTVVPGSSFLGSNVYPGAEDVLNGIKPVFDMQKYS